jgi:hypothetical protein
MKCEDVIHDLRIGTVPLGAALQHLAECEHCQAARQAIVALEVERAQPVPRLAEGAFERALLRAVQPRPRVAGRAPGFWLGTVVGGALAASVAVGVTIWWVPPPGPSSAAANPQVRLALHEVRDVSVSLDSPVELMGTEIHVVLTGAIGLQGFAEQRELRWTTDLDRGVNQLTLPLVALGPNGGQVMVEVQHGDKRRAFVVDVQTTDDAARQTAASRARPSAV